MNPKELAMIMKDSLEQFEKWYAGHPTKKASDKESLAEAYTQAQINLVAQIQQIMGDDFLIDDGKNIPEGEALQTWLTGAFTRKIQEYAHSINIQK